MGISVIFGNFFLPFFPVRPNSRKFWNVGTPITSLFSAPPKVGPEIWDKNSKKFPEFPNLGEKRKKIRESREVLGPFSPKFGGFWVLFAPNVGDFFPLLPKFWGRGVLGNPKFGNFGIFFLGAFPQFRGFWGGILGLFSSNFGFPGWIFGLILGPFL